MKLFDILGANGMEKASETVKAVRTVRKYGSNADFVSSPLEDAEWLVAFAQQWLDLLNQDVEFLHEGDTVEKAPPWDGPVQ